MADESPLETKSESSMRTLFHVEKYAPKPEPKLSMYADAAKALRAKVQFSKESVDWAVPVKEPPRPL